MSYSQPNVGMTSFRDGYITFADGTIVALKDLAQINSAGEVVNIYGRPISISVLNANKLGNKLPSEYMLKSEMPYVPTSNICVDSNVSIDSAELDIMEAEIGYVGQSTNILTAPMGAEILSNTELVTTDGYTAGNSAVISANTGVLTVRNETVGDGYASTVVTLENDKYYLISAVLGGSSPGFDILKPDGQSLTTWFTGKRVIYAAVGGNYILKFRCANSGTNIAATFSNVSVKEIDVRTLQPGEYYTLQDPMAGVITKVVTGIAARDLNHDVSVTYSKEPGKNVAFIKDSFTLLEYKHITPGLIGFQRDLDNQYTELVKDANGIYVGDFDNTSDALAYSIVGNITKTVITTGGSLDLKRTSASGTAEANINLTNAPVGKLCYFEFVIQNIVDTWSFYIGSTRFQIVPTGDSTTDKRRYKFVVPTDGPTLIRFVADSATTTANLKIGAFHGYIVDDAVWKNVTPVNNSQTTSVYDCNTLDCVITAASGAARTDSTFSTLIGAKWRLPGYNQPATVSATLWVDSVRSFDNDGITLGGNTYGCNQTGVQHSLYATLYTKLVMHKDNRGTLSLIAFNEATNASCIYSNKSPDSSVGEILPHMLSSAPISVTQYPISYKGNVMRYVRPDDQEDRTIGYNPYTTATPAVGITTTMDVNEFDVNSFTVVTQQAVSKQHYYKCVGETEHRKEITYAGNNTQVILPCEFQVARLTITPLEYVYDKLSVLAGISKASYVYNTSANAAATHNDTIGKVSSGLVLIKPNTAIGSINSNTGKKFLASIVGYNTTYPSGVYALALPRTSVGGTGIGITGTGEFIITSTDANNNQVASKHNVTSAAFAILTQDDIN